MRLACRALAIATPLALLAAACERGSKRGPTDSASTDSSSTDSSRTTAAHGRMDLVPDTMDANGFPLNPRWWVQRLTDSLPDTRVECGGFAGTGPDLRPPTYGAPPCTTEAARLTYDYGDVTRFTCDWRFRADDRSFHGHLNWYPATFAGQLHYEGASETTPITGPFGDKDLNFLLETPRGAGLTLYNHDRDALSLEMDRRETAALWRSQWWHALAARAFDRDGVERLVGGRRARVTGLFGLDGVHDYHAELHPVYAMAVQLDSVRAASGDRWAVFARNSGNEGFCSQRGHPLAIPSDTVRVEIDWFPGATAATLDSAQDFAPRGAGASLVALQVDTLAHRAALVFVLPRATNALLHAEERAMVDGLAVVRWRVPAGTPATIATATGARAIVSSPDEAEAALDTLVRRLPAAERQSLAAQLTAVDRQESARRAARDSAELRTARVQARQRARAGTTVAPLARARVSVAAPPGPALPVDSLDLRRDSLVAAALCRAPTDSQVQRLCARR